MAREIIGIIARMEWDITLNLLPAMGRSPGDSRLIQDVESPGHLGAGFLQKVVDMMDVHGAVELFVIGSSPDQGAQEILDRITSLRASSRIPAGVPIHGLLYDPVSHRLELVLRGYEERVGHEVL